jgi:hypothetical protein
MPSLKSISQIHYYGHIENSWSSPFLKLPGEIRDMIYYAALVKPTPIDLWPNKFDDNPLSNPTLAERIGKKPEDKRKCYSVRLQTDLEYLRKEMAPSLLSTCWQIRRECVDIFWRQNTFRFSSDMTWLGARRFLNTVGSEAIARIENLQICAPIENFWVEHRQNIKNHPKLHMTKHFHSRHTTVYNFADVEDNVAFTLRLLDQSKALKSLQLVVPESFTIKYTSPFSFPSELLQTPMFNWLDIDIVIETGAQVEEYNLFRQEPYGLFNITCLPGSKHALQPAVAHQHPSLVEITQKVFIESEQKRYQDLTGIESLFSMDAEGQGGFKPKKNSGSKRKTNARVLNCFGGCRFVACKGCWECHWGYNHIRGTHLLIKNRKRAARQGFVRP